MRISVALATYNGQRFLPALLDSLLSQDRPPDEVVASDDASTDGTNGLLAEFAASAPFRVVHRINPGRLGTTGNFSAAAERTTGEVVCFADQDDIWDARKMQIVEEAMPDDPGAVLHDALLVDQTDRPTGASLWSALDFSPVERGDLTSGAGLAVLARRNVVTGATFACTRSVLEVALPFSPHGLHDVWLGLISAAMASIRTVELDLLHYRQHEGNQVGAPLRRAGAKLDRRRRLGDVTADEILLWTDLRERLLARKALASESHQMAVIDAKLAHLRVRGGLPGSRFRRIVPVVREWRRGGYRRYARGLESAAYDVALRPAPPGPSHPLATCEPE